VNVNYLLETLTHYQPAVSIVILDACRDNPFKSLFKSGGVVNGFANQPTPLGILLAYATLMYG